MTFADLKLTSEELDRYAPYHTFPQFNEGFYDYARGVNTNNLSDGVGAQAYDRGAEMAMRRAIQKIREKA